MQKTFYAPIAVATLTVISLSGCAGRMARNEQEEQQDQAKRPQSALQTPPASTDISTPAAATAPEAAATAENPRATSIGMNARLDAMEAKLSTMNDKLDATRASLDNFLAAHQPKATGAPRSASDNVGIPVASAPVATDSETGYVNDQAIQQYRKAEILLESQRYAEAILVFSNFLEHYPDHALAGSAQFHIGEAYFKQKQWPIAEQEFQKVLTSYDRSIHISDTLRMMATVEDHLGKAQEAARHRQQLSSLFANSPSAAQAEAAVQTAPAAESQAAAPAHETAPSTQEAPPAAVSPGTKPGLDGPPPTAPSEKIGNE